MKSLRKYHQIQALEWAERCFGHACVHNVVERVTRVLEEATELAQAEGLSKEMAHKIVDYVYSRPAGDPPQEVGGVCITLLVYCEVKGYDADTLEHQELDRILSKPEKHFAVRQAARSALGVALDTTGTPSPMSTNQQYFFIVFKRFSTHIPPGYADYAENAVLDVHPTVWLAEELKHLPQGQGVRLLFWQEITHEQYALLAERMG